MLRSIASGVLEVAGIEGSPAPVSGGGVSAVYYSPWQNLEEIDYNAIVSSRCNHLDIAIYSFTDWKLAQAAVIFARSGRLVRIYRDYEQYEQEQKRGLQVAHMLKRPNISVRLKSSTVLMHMKAWSDGCILREGSRTGHRVVKSNKTTPLLSSMIVQALPVSREHSKQCGYGTATSSSNKQPSPPQC